MKHLKSILAAALFLLVLGVANAQDENNPWLIEVGINAVDVFPTGADGEDRIPNLLNGDLFEEFFNVEDHWNILPSVSRISVGRYVGSGFSVAAAGSINSIERIGNFRVDDLEYYSLDGEIKYSFNELIPGADWFDPILGIGGGYTWVESQTTGGDIGFGTANGLAGFRFWLNESLSLSLQSTYKHSFNDFGVRHFQHSAGIAFKFGGKDTDGDGIYDQDDECPGVAGSAAFNGCPDTDGDGIEDRNDTCPDVAGSAEFNGCADTDGDGIADPKDACPNEAGLADQNGCPDPDTDGDGIKDSKDGCPNEVGPEANNGCPYQDKDNDGVLDKDDECPEVPGTTTNNGCPEVTVEIINQLTEYAKTILFDTGRTTIRPESYAILQNMVDIMKEYPTASFVIEGHTDSQGREETNQRLSDERAASVKSYLTTIGLDGSRLSSIGYGESRPITTNKTKAGRAQNRRVEISLKK